MAEDIINVEGKDVVVREDTAKAYRGVHWAFRVVAICLVIAAMIAIGLFFRAASNGGLQTPITPDATISR